MLKTEKAINLSGKMSILGVTKLSNRVLKQMEIAAKSFYYIDDLLLEVEKKVAKHFGASDSFITSSASAGIFHAIMGIKASLGLSLEQKIKVGLPKGHHINYGAPITDIIKLAGASIIKLENSTILDNNNSKTFKGIDAMFFVSSHHSVQGNYFNAATFQKYYKNIPTIIDIAAEEDIWKFIQLGYTYTIVSGSKAIGAPTSGFVLCNKQNKNYLIPLRKSYGRSMKIGKENIAGLCQAIQEYKKNRKMSKAEENIDIFVKEINKNTSFTAQISKDLSRDINRIAIISTKQKIKKLLIKLHKNNIWAREYRMNEGIIEFDLRQVEITEMKKVIKLIGGKDD